MTPTPRRPERVYRTELIHAEIARLVAVDLGQAPGGGPVCWALWIDAAPVAATDEPMTDEQAQHWARRMLGEHVRFEPGHRDGGYWVTTPTRLLDPTETPATSRGCTPLRAPGPVVLPPRTPTGRSVLQSHPETDQPGVTG